jgi:hypothetical protein
MCSRFPALVAFALAALALASCGPASRPPASALILWAWERPEDLRFAGAEAEVAVQTGFVEIGGDGFAVRGRRFPLRVARPPATALVHVQIDRARPLLWTPTLRARRVQLDFEVRASERAVLLDVLRDLRRALPRGTLLSMTALASWCDTEGWLDTAPVDEIVPMLFRMGREGEALKYRLAAGGDFRNPRCRAAFAVSTDSPIVRAPPGRRVYMFNPRSWTAADLETAQARMEGWR